jgi:hypothetical protein
MRLPQRLVIGTKMVDPIARKCMRDLLKKLALGRITSYQSENELLDLYPNCNDPVIYALYRTVAEMGGDVDKPLAHLFAKGGEMRKRVCRWIFFLGTNLEYEWPKERLAPGVRDFYKPNWFDKLFGLQTRILHSNQEFFGRGDYSVWPFFRESDFNAAKTGRIRKRNTFQTP